MTVQLSTACTDPEWHNTLHHSQTDRQMIVSCQWPILLCAALQSAKNQNPRYIYYE